MSKKIEELTPEQTERFPEFADKWLKIGLSTTPADRDVAEAALRRCYQIAGLDQPKQIIWTTSPLAGCVLVGILKNEKLMRKILASISTKATVTKVGDSVWDSVRASVGASVWDSVGASVRASVWASVWDSVWDSVRASVGDSVWDSVWDSVRASVGDSVRASVGASVWDSVGASVWDSVGASVRASVVDSVWDSVGDSYKENFNPYYRYLGQFDAGYLGWCDFFREVCNLVEQTEKAVPLSDLTKHSSWVYPYRNIAVLSEKPEIIKVNAAGKIHCDSGPCVRYRDGFSVYGLNGVRVTQEIVETPSDQLSAALILTEKNAEIRREIVRKIGTERLCRDLNAQSIDKEGTYELLLLDLKDGRHRPYLKMKNPSIDTWHVEGVHPDCKTVDQALAWRNGVDVYKSPEILT